jgi:uracil-DNA glycosylase family 4
MKSLPLYTSPPYQALELAMSEARSLNPGCTLCTLHEKVRSPCLPAEGTSGGLLVIGEGPQAEDDRQGVPFTSPSGGYVRQLVAKHWNGPVVYDNAVRCFPGAREITDSALSSCRPYLAKTLTDAAPTRILLLGADALKSVVGRTFNAMSSRRGYVYMESMGIPAFMLLPPAMALRNRYIRQMFEDDVVWALQATPAKPPTGSFAHYMQTLEETRDACFELASADFFSFDNETFGAIHDPEFKVTTLACSPAGTTDAFVWDEHALRNPAIVAELKKVFENPKIPKGGQNVKYDALTLRGMTGIQTRGITFDVRLMRKLLEADAFANLEIMQTRVGMGGGKDEAAEHVKAAVANMRKALFNRNPGVTPKTGKPRALKIVEPFNLDLATEKIMLDRVESGVEPKRYAYAFMPENVRGVYCARDAVSTTLLKDVFAGDLAQRPELIDLWNDVVVPLQHGITEMEWNGIKVDVQAMLNLQKVFELKEATILARITPYVWSDFNPSASSPDTGKLLFSPKEEGGLGLKPARLTPTGKPGTGADDLAEISHPLVLDILEIRKVRHFKGTYVDGMLRFIRADGRIHPSIKIDGTETGRPSCEQPNMLNIPRADSPDGKLCRDLFIAEDGYEIVEGDYNQIELRVAAMLSDDDVMIGVFKSGADFHLATAKMIAPYFKVDPDIVTKEHPLRSRAKIVNFGVLYGKDAYGLAMELGISKKEAQLLIDTILGRFRKLAAWIQTQLRNGRLTGWTRTWWNGKDARYRPLWALGSPQDDLRQTAERSTWNTSIQGTATEFTNASIGAIQKRIEEDNIPARLILTVYDSIIAEVRSDAVEEYAWHANKIMCGWPSKDMPIKADFKHGKSWGTMSELKVA